MKVWYILHLVVSYRVKTKQKLKKQFKQYYSYWSVQVFQLKVAKKIAKQGGLVFEGNIV